MKHKLIIFILFTCAVASLLVTGCTNQEGRAQALLVEAISYSEGTPPSVAARDAALKLAATKGYTLGKDSASLTERELIMVAGRELCKQIMAEYPTTPAAVKAAEMRNQINQKLKVISEARISSYFNTDN